MVSPRTTGPIVRSLQPSLQRLTDELLKFRTLWVPTNSGWTAAVTGSGGSTQVPSNLLVNTGATASSTALVYTTPVLHDATASNGINFSKRLLFAFSIKRVSSDAQVVARVQLKAASTEGDLAAGGVGIQISNLTLVGEGYGSAQAETSTLATLTASQVYDIVILCDQPKTKIDFYVNQVLQQSITAAANIPSGSIGARLMCSIIRGATGATDSEMHLGNVLVATEY